MAYERLHWVESETPLSADNMNNIEDGIEELQSQKVDKVSGKGLSDQNYTSDEKTKLAGIEAGAEVNPGEATTSDAGLMSAADKSKLDGVQAGAQVNRTYTAVTGKPTAAASPAFGGTVTVSQVAQSSTGQVSVTDRVITIPSSDATTSAHGLMTAADKTKLNGIATGAEVNQNAFSNVKVGSTTVAADSKTDTLTLAAGSNVTLTPDATNDKVTIAATDTTYSAATTSAAGLMSAADKTKLNGIDTGATKNQVSTKTLTISSTKTINANSAGTIQFTGSTGTYTAIKKIDLVNTAGTAISSLCVSGFSSTSGSCTVKLYNPTNAAITVGTASTVEVLVVG